MSSIPRAAETGQQYQGSIQILGSPESGSFKKVAFAPAVMYIGAQEVGWTCVTAAAKWLLAKSYIHVVEVSSRYRQAWLIYYLRSIQPTLPF
jgi:hypothetical protein